MQKNIRNISRVYLNKILQKTDISLDGNRPWDVQVSDPRFYLHVMFGGSLALGESYMNGWWDCDSLDQFFFRLLRYGDRLTLKNTLTEFPHTLKARFINRQRKARAFKIGEHHYDVGNDLFQAMLDNSMAYSCGYWRKANTLEEAQLAKYELICQKLSLKPGMRLLDIGCGWGGLLSYAAKHYGVEGVGLTVSKEQAKLARQRCTDLPITILHQDYRSYSGHFDAVVSVGMFEHVGYKNYRIFMRLVNQVLDDNGLFLLHTMGSNETGYACDPWFNKYIFPGGMLPSIKQIGETIEPYFIMEDWQNMGVDYERTTLSWCRNFEESWTSLKGQYDETFYRMWRYYLLAIAGAFRARYMQVWQIILSPRGDSEGYRSVRCEECVA